MQFREITERNHSTGGLLSMPDTTCRRDLLRPLAGALRWAAWGVASVLLVFYALCFMQAAGWPPCSACCT